MHSALPAALSTLHDREMHNALGDELPSNHQLDPADIPIVLPGPFPALHEVSHAAEQAHGDCAFAAHSLASAQE
eukprot:13842393-Alexandrium_andersonii.AAC.1